MTTHTARARLRAAAAALEAVDRAQRQWLACLVDASAAEHEASVSRYRACLRAEVEAYDQMLDAQEAATAALAAVGEAAEASPPPSGDLAHLIAQEHETAAALSCMHPDDEEGHE